jgi:hypothetical protein
LATTLTDRPPALTRERHQLLITVNVAVAILMGYCLVRGWSLHGYQLPLCLGCAGLAVYPTVRWARFQPYSFPAFETFMLTCITAYVLPLITEHSGVMSYSDDVVTMAMFSVLVFEACAIFAFTKTQAVERRSDFWTGELFASDIRPWLPFGIWLHVAYLFVGIFTDLIPPDIDSVLRAVFFGISTTCSFLLGRYWGADQLPYYQKPNIIISFGLVVILQMVSLYLITSIACLIVFFLAFISAGRRVPWVTLVVLFAVFSVLHNGKTKMREKYWEQGAASPGVTEIPAFFTEWAGYGIQAQSDENPTAKQTRLLERASLLQMLCRIIDASNHNLPYLMGETYLDIIPQLVPRIFWADKPSGQATTKRLSIYYGLQDEESTRTTSIAFGTLAEAYGNFGIIGMAGFGLFVGWATKIISIWTRKSPLLSNGGLIMILLMAWCIQVELPLSVWISSLYQATICVLLIPFLVRFLIP